jgi:hypothetical protein
MERLDHLGWVEHRRYRISGQRLQVRTTSERFAEWLDYALPAYQVRGKGDALYSIVISDGAEEGRPGRRFHLLYRMAIQVVRSLSAQTVAGMLLGELESIDFPSRTDALYLKAALLSSGGRTALLPSSFLTWIGGLGRHVERAGVQLPSSKMVAIDRHSAKVIPVEPRLKVPEDAADRLRQVFPSDGPPERAVLARPTSVDVVYTVVSRDHQPVSPSSRAYTLQRLAGSLVNGRLMGGETLRTLGDLVQGAECYQLGFGDPRSMLQAIAESLSNG